MCIVVVCPLGDARESKKRAAGNRLFWNPCSGFWTLKIYNEEKVVLVVFFFNYINSSKIKKKISDAKNKQKKNNNKKNIYLYLMTVTETKPVRLSNRFGKKNSNLWSYKALWKQPWLCLNMPPMSNGCHVPPICCDTSGCYWSINRHNSKLEDVCC